MGEAEGAGRRRAPCEQAALELTALFLLAYELTGRIEPAAAARVQLHGATTPFEATAESEQDGRFRFRKVEAGTYTLAVANAVETVEVGPSTVDAKGRVDVVLRIDDIHAANATVSATVLSIPDRAVHEFEEAQKCLSRRDSDCAAGHLSMAVKIAPQFVAAWNARGVIDYQTRRYSDAEANFRRALTTDPGAYEPLVNLGGVLLNLDRPADALAYNQRAVSQKPNDALANSQLGLSYFGLHQFDLAEKYLKTAITLDPAHFSYPQLTLAEICLRRGDRQGALEQLRAFLDHHPDSPQAAVVHRQIEELSK